MARLHERVILPAGELEILFESPESYVLRYGEHVEYRKGVKRVRGVTSPYRFRSVEQLRYDFERDLEAA